MTDNGEEFIIDYKIKDFSLGEKEVVKLITKIECENNIESVNGFYHFSQNFKQIFGSNKVQIEVHKPFMSNIEITDINPYPKTISYQSDKVFLDWGELDTDTRIEFTYKYYIDMNIFVWNLIVPIIFMFISYIIGIYDPMNIKKYIKKEDKQKIKKKKG